MNEGRQDGDGNEDRIGEGGGEAKNRTRVVDSMRETGETWVERFKKKNVDKEGLVQ